MGRKTGTAKTPLENKLRANARTLLDSELMDGGYSGHGWSALKWALRTHVSKERLIEQLVKVNRKFDSTYTTLKADDHLESVYDTRWKKWRAQQKRLGLEAPRSAAVGNLNAPLIRNVWLS